MYLSRLEIFGFKSFANKVTLSFDSGITSIVGPNGCGKTNVVDAIRWALGEQKPTMLRSDKMEDVIFNGTKGRKPLSIAEVSLTIENTKGILPSEYSEVTITRRVYRSGEGEYYLNKVQCRLKDIRDLFMDTGMGSDAYSVIELKMVEIILSDRTEDRRRLFEEAAGVTKYKHRRKEALRRLESVEQDLVRVNDIIREVSKAVGSLERQAQKAERYNRLMEQLRVLEVDLLTREYSDIVVNIKPLREKLLIATAEKQKGQTMLEREEAMLDALREEITLLEKNSGGVQSSYNAKQAQLHELERRNVASRERIRLLNDNIRRYEDESAALTSRRTELEQKNILDNRRLEAIRISIQDAEGVHERKKQDLAEFGEKRDQKKTEAKECQAHVIQSITSLSELRSNENNLRAKLENDRGRLAFILEENENYERDTVRSIEEGRVLSEKDRTLRHSFSEANVKLHRAEEYKVLLAKDVERLRERDYELRTEIERRQAKLDFLRGLMDSFDGFPEGARTLLASHEWTTRVDSTVADALDAQPQHRIAIESALGEALSYLIMRNTEDAFAAMQFLKHSQKGKTTFVCLDRIPEIPRRSDRVPHPGTAGWALDAIDFEPEYEPLFRILLENVLIVDSVQSAREVLTNDSSIRCITSEGELITARGVLRGGSSRMDEGEHIGKQKQIEELSNEIIDLQEQRKQLNELYKKKTEEHTRLNVKHLGELAHHGEQEITTVEIRMAQIEFEKRRALETIERNATEYARIEHEIDDLEKTLETLTPNITRAEQQISEAERAVGAVNSELQTMEVLWTEFSRAANEAQMVVMNLQSEIREVQMEIEHSRQNIATIEATINQRRLDSEAASSEITTLTLDVAETEERLVVARKDFEELQTQKSTIDGEIYQKRSRIHDIELKLKDERARHEELLEAIHELEIKIQELTMKSEGLRSKAREGFDIELQLGLFPEDGFDLNSAKNEVQNLKDRIRQLGAINHAAFEEYKSEKERLDFVIAQSKDLEDSKNNLVTTIEEINTTAQNLFVGTFTKIRENFIQIFKGLFDDGDEADLRLEEGMDPLEGKIEITAKPRGKRPTSIDLLSGGEKTLTATALLFAIYLVKPSPFCILDEVDAPLDDANIDRFTRLINKFAVNTQFIVVTHNKRTMEAAKTMYGVTMEEEGVSKIVSVRFNEALLKV
jgi:chromosome segregation protein